MRNNEKKWYALFRMVLFINLSYSELEEFHELTESQNTTNENRFYFANNSSRQSRKYNYLYVDDYGENSDIRFDNYDNDYDTEDVLNYAYNEYKGSRIKLPYNDDASNKMYESNTFYYTREPLIRYKDMNKIKEPGIADENWPYPESTDEHYFGNRTSRLVCPKCKCGERFTPKIAGGSVTTRGKYPWMVLLAFKRSFTCGGSMINNKYVLTAAHCLAGFPINDLTCRFREFDRTVISEKPRQFIRKLARYWIHAKYDAFKIDFDIGLIKLRSPVNHKSLIRPICLPLRGGSWGGNNRSGYITGWGDKFSGPPTVASHKLKQVKVKIHTNKKCREVNGSGITKRQICAGQPGQEACRGDSGGPLVVKYNKPRGRFKQIGIVSYGYGPRECGVNFGVYTRVTEFRNWILKKASRNACFCND